MSRITVGIATLSMFLSIAHAEVVDQIDAIVRAEIPNSFQGNIYVHDRNGEVFSHSYGMADLEWNVPNSRSTIFRIGSVTKQFTANAILKLFAEGRIHSLQDPIGNYIPVRPSWRTVTFHQLLTHTAGLPHDPQYVNPTDYHPLKEVADWVLKIDPTPMATYSYSNAGYELLAYLVQVISGQFYEDYVLQNVLRPSGLNNTGPDLDRIIPPERARGYMLLQGLLSNMSGIDLSITDGAGNFVSTVDDLYKWDQLLRGEQILPASIRDLQFGQYAPTGNPNEWYGYGWAIDKQWPGHTLIWHNGAINGYTSDFARYVDDGLVIIGLSNRYEAGASLIRIRQKIAKLLLSK